MRQHWKKIVAAVVVLAALGVGGFLFWFYVLKDDPPPALTTSDLDAALADTAVDTIVVANTTPTDSNVGSASPAPVATTSSVSGAVADDSPSGAWALTLDSTLGYRIQEVLSGLDTEAAGRTNDAAGTLTIDGTSAAAAEFTVNMASMTSDSSRRDDQFRTRIMTVDEFPTSTFVLTSPIDFGSVPTEGTTITATATGDLTLRGVTNSVTFDVQAKLENGRIGVLGNIPILFSDYEIPDPSNQVATVKDDGFLEFVLVFERA
jgi:polyisoprenoid-binding protein YceI